MNIKAFNEFKKKVEDGKVNVYPPYYHANYNPLPILFVERKDSANCDAAYAHGKQLDWTLGYIAGMKKARKLLSTNRGKKP